VPAGCTLCFEPSCCLDFLGGGATSIRSTPSTQVGGGWGVGVTSLSFPFPEVQGPFSGAALVDKKLLFSKKLSASKRPSCGMIQILVSICPHQPFPVLGRGRGSLLGSETYMTLGECLWTCPLSALSSMSWPCSEGCQEVNRTVCGGWAHGRASPGPCVSPAGWQSEYC
jgi:hypothetical protein